MSTYDKASLVLIPSGTKESKIFSQKPTNGDGDFDFSRASAATRVNADGLIEKERGNLLLQSNQFDTTWTFGGTLTSGQSGYDGSSDAWLLDKTGASQNVNQTISLSGVQTFSVYAKAGSVDWIRLLYVDGTGQNRQDFDLANGVLGTSGTNNIDAEITSIGSGWYRVSVTANTTTTTLRIYPMTTDNDTTGTSGNIYIQDAQLEVGLVATDYIETTTAAVYSGITDNIPRLDYTDASCPSLKLEPQRTNLVENSEYHSGSTYGNNDVSTTDNQAISPEGLQNAAKIVLDSGTNISNGGHHYSFSSTGGTTYTISVFAKAGEYRYFTFTYGSISACGGHFDLQEGVKLGDITNAQYTNTSASIEDYDNGWYRLIVSLTDTITTSNRFLSMKPSPSASVPSNNNYSSTGDGTSGAYIYGFQMEESSYPTSYIPTYGSAVTRNAETCNNAGNASTFNDSEGVLYAEIAALSDDLVNRYIGVCDGTDDERVLIGLRNSSNSVRSIITGGSASAGIVTFDISDITIFNKIAIRYNSSEMNLWINGTEVATDSSFILPTGLSQINFNSGQGSSPFYGKTKQILYFPTALTDEELATLTTI